MENPIQLTHRFTEAVDYARHVHVELRKGTQVPYMAHLLAVASLVLGETGHIGLHKHVSYLFYYMILDITGADIKITVTKDLRNFGVSPLASLAISRVRLENYIAGRYPA